MLNHNSIFLPWSSVTRWIYGIEWQVNSSLWNSSWKSGIICLFSKLSNPKTHIHIHIHILKLSLLLSSEVKHTIKIYLSSGHCFVWKKTETQSVHIKKETKEKKICVKIRFVGQNCWHATLICGNCINTIATEQKNETNRKWCDDLKKNYLLCMNCHQSRANYFASFRNRYFHPFHCPFIMFPLNGLHAENVDWHEKLESYFFFFRFALLCFSILLCIGTVSVVKWRTETVCQHAPNLEQITQ